MQLVRVIVRGPEVIPTDPKGVDFGGVTYKREEATTKAIYMALRVPSRRDRFQWTRPDDEKMQVTKMQLPFSKEVILEFCSGTCIDKIVDAVARAGSDDAKAVLEVSPLLRHMEKYSRI